MTLSLRSICCWWVETVGCRRMWPRRRRLLQSRAPLTLRMIFLVRFGIGHPIRHQQLKRPSPFPVQNVLGQGSNWLSIVVGSTGEEPELEALNSATNSSVIAVCDTGPRRPKQDRLRPPCELRDCHVLPWRASWACPTSPPQPHQAELIPTDMSILQGYLDSTPSAGTKQGEDPLAQALEHMTRPKLSRAATSEGFFLPRLALSRSGTAENAALSARIFPSRVCTCDHRSVSFCGVISVAYVFFTLQSVLRLMISFAPLYLIQYCLFYFLLSRFLFSYLYSNSLPPSIA
ncbi:hypothetical protein CONPUDRAFT_167252 [Coniophora puteana RWD-64-598 SS2]|uniref:Uncharacterized protein n=1 Tax=Coniophora puteana (strain RWD-64-598) TaxID=741705 RepID=A0A5M3MG13_CONPW|nr:uncharacterized protein CONPUDRAFT_167252 [Coniophora puteana RWD-64-598 SS2]EIW78188.1 hypothetical protein CONPUDRAFT_167252 [Coniophora puteana RWD-64-598 SS2]